MNTVFWYLFRSFLTRFVFLLIMIGAVLQLLDLLANTSDILAGEGNGVGSLYRYVLLRSPQIITTIVPFTVLLAALVVFAAFAQHSEIIVMKASGLSPVAILLPMIVGGSIIGVLHFSFNETVVISSTVDLRVWENQGYAANASFEESSSAVWMDDGQASVRAKTVSDNGARLSEVSIMRYDEVGNVASLLTADAAQWESGQWTLLNAELWAAEDNTIQAFERLQWDSDATPEQFLFLAVRPDEVSFRQLRAHVAELEAKGAPVDYFKTWLHQKVSGPMGALIMPLFATLVGFGIYRGGGLTLRFIAGLGLGFGFFVVVNLMIALGTYGAVPPIVAAWFPALLFFSIGTGLIIYREA